MPPPKQRTAELQARVLDVALTTLADGGVSGFTTRKVATGASTSTKAVYELFGDKAGLLREVFFEGFRRLAAQLAALPTSSDPRHDLVDALLAIRAFVRENPVLADLMFSRPFASFDPGPDELRGGASVREVLVARVKRLIDADRATGNPTDIAHVLLAVVQGLAAQEQAGWLGTSAVSVNRRWKLAFAAVLDGLAV